MKPMTHTKTRFVFSLFYICAAIVGISGCAGSGENILPDAGDLEAIQLVDPTTQGGRPLFDVLMDRKSMRSFTDEMLPVDVLSNMLWAAFGINRPESGKRTAPSAVNWQEIDIYVSTAEGLYLYDHKVNLLKPVLDRDVRAKTGRFIQPFVAKAPVNLVYVADFSRVGMKGIVLSDADKLLYAAVSTGCIVQNVYLYCASEGLGTVVRGLVDKAELSEIMGLSEHQKIIVAQTVGYPEK
ncbi:nitroreductase family protein [Thermodesulfobacteriota bacterium]